MIKKFFLPKKMAAQKVAVLGVAAGLSMAGIPSAHPLLDTEAVRLVSSMPPWNPTVVNGRKKAFYYEVYIVFSW